MGQNVQHDKILLYQESKHLHHNFINMIQLENFHGKWTMGRKELVTNSLSKLFFIAYEVIFWLIVSDVISYYLFQRLIVQYSLSNY